MSVTRVHRETGRASGSADKDYWGRVAEARDRRLGQESARNAAKDRWAHFQGEKMRRLAAKGKK